MRRVKRTLLLLLLAIGTQDWHPSRNSSWSKHSGRKRLYIIYIISLYTFPIYKYLWLHQSLIHMYMSQCMCSTCIMYIIACPITWIMQHYCIIFMCRLCFPSLILSQSILERLLSRALPSTWTSCLMTPPPSRPSFSSCPKGQIQWVASRDSPGRKGTLRRSRLYPLDRDKDR